MKVLAVLCLALAGVWSIAAGFPSGAIPLWVGSVAIAGRKSADDGIDAFYGVMLGGLLVACAMMLVFQKIRAMLGW